MPVNFRLVFLPLSFLLLLVHTPFAASVHCWELNAIADDPRNYPTVEINGKTVIRVHAADCLHIVSALPQSLHCDPLLQAVYKAPTLTYGPLVTHRFDLPAYVRHNSCEVRLEAAICDIPDRPWRAFTRKESAFYIWNSLKAEVEAIVHTCPTGCGWGTVHEDEVGLPKTMKGKNSVTVYPAELLTALLGDTLHIYNV